MRYTKQSLKNKKKSPGKDKIIDETLKLVVKKVTPPFIINWSSQTGEYPSVFKDGLTTATHKNGEKTNVNNYRTITIISTVAKVFEKIK